jgi:hypothetical protein
VTGVPGGDSMPEAGPAGGPEGGAVLLLTAWHLPRMRSMPRQFWRFRRLDRRSRGVRGLVWSHRWISRRSLLYTSRWRSEADARAWLASAEFRRFDEGVRAAGAEPRLEWYRPA